MKNKNNLLSLSKGATTTKSLLEATDAATARAALAEKRLHSARDFVLMFADFWDLIVQYKPKKMRERSILFNNLHDNAHHLEKGQLYVDFETVEFSKTNVAGVDNLTLKGVAANSCTLTWDRQQGHRSALDAHTADTVLFFYNETIVTTAFFMQLPYRVAGKEDIVLPHYTVGDVIHCWMLLHWEKEKIISDIEYAIIDV